MLYFPLKSSLWFTLQDTVYEEVLSFLRNLKIKEELKKKEKEAKDKITKQEER